jgi:hypothetical protein
MAQKVPFQYAQLPVYQYRTFDLNTLTFSSHPIIPPEQILFNNQRTDEPSKKDQDSPPVTDPPPTTEAAEAATETMDGKALRRAQKDLGFLTFV